MRLPITTSAWVSRRDDDRASPVGIPTQCQPCPARSGRSTFATTSQIEHRPRRPMVWLTAVRLMNRQGTSFIMMQPTQQFVASFPPSFSSGMRDGTGATLRGLAGGWLCPSPTQTRSLSNPTHSVTTQRAGGLVGYVLATTAPRCLDMVGAVMLLRCQQAMSLSGVSAPSWCCVGGRRRNGCKAVWRAT